MEHIRKLLTFTQVIQMKRDKDEVIQALVEGIASVITTADLVGYFANQDDERFIGRSSNLHGKEIFYDIKKLQIDVQNDSFVSEIMQLKTWIYIPDTSIDHRIDQEKESLLKIYSILGMPILVNNHVIGIIFVHDIGKPMHLTAEQIDLIESFANVVGVALENIETMQQNQLMLHDQMILTEAAELLAESQSVHQVFETCSSFILKITKSDYMAIHLINSHLETTSPFYVAGGDVVTQTQLKNLYGDHLYNLRNHTIFQEVVSGKKALAISDVNEDMRVNRTICETLNIKSLLVLPLKAKDLIVGILTIPSIAYPREYSSKEIENCQSIANMVGVSLSNVMYAEHLEQAVSERTLELNNANQKLALLLQDLQIRESQLRALLDALPSGVVFKDENGKWLEANKSATSLFGLNNIDTLNLTSGDLSIFSTANTYLLTFDHQSDEKVRLKEQGISCELTTVLPNEMEKTLRVQKRPIKYAEGFKTGILIVLEDITEQRMAEEMLRKTDKLSIIGQMAAGIAHEIRNPLTVLKGFLQLLNNDEGYNKYYQIMLSEINRINAITEELLFLSKPHLPPFEQKNLKKIINDVVVLFDTQAILSNIQLKVFIEDQPYILWCSEIQIKQLLINLLQNAKEAMPNGGIIEISARTTNSGMIALTIKDQGTGISPERLQNLGEPFYTTKEKGTGLGLMICYKIVELHKGTLSIDSEPGNGTSVTMFFPNHNNLELD